MTTPMNTLLTKLADWRGFRALVVGDYMLDQLLYGDAERLSSDAPVPVLRVTRTEDRPGGAANLCLDLTAMRGRVVSIGVVGRDQEAELLQTALRRQGVETSGLVVDSDRPTTVKRSLVGLAQGRHAQKMFRVDFESRAAVSERLEAALLESFERHLPDADVVCLEDYNKGVCTPTLCQAMIERCRAAGKPIFVDPAGLTDYDKYRGASALTPNRTEAEKATGRRGTQGAQGDPEHNAQVGATLLDRLDLDAVVLTLDKEGSLLVERDGEAPVPVPTVARDVYDVTGAGDMMLAGLAAARANGLTWRESVEFANAAAGLEVEVFGVVPIPFERIHNELLARHAERAGKVYSLDELMIRVSAARRSGRRIVFTNGCFDVLHAGHVALLERAASFGDFLVVGMNDDASVRGLKGEGRPVNDEVSRARVLGALKSVDAIIFFGDPTPIKLIESLLPDVLVKGADYSPDEVVGGEVVQRAGGRVELVELVEGLSTTATIAQIRGNNGQ